MTYDESLELISRIKSAWPSFKQNEWSAREWHKSLSRFTITQINTAFDKLKISSKYAPVISDFYSCLEAQGVTRHQSADNTPLNEVHDGCRAFYIRSNSSDKGTWIKAGYDAIENLIKFKGRYIRKVEYLCETFGSQKVTELYKDWCLEHNIWGTKSLARLIKNEKFPLEQYKVFLNDLMQLADSA